MTPEEQFRIISHLVEQGILSSNSFQNAYVRTITGPESNYPETAKKFPNEPVAESVTEPQRLAMVDKFRESRHNEVMKNLSLMFMNGPIKPSAAPYRATLPTLR